MQQLTIPDGIAGILPLLATILSAYLSGKYGQTLSAGAKAAIALGSVLVVAIACELLAGNLTGGAVGWFGGVLGYVAIVMGGDLSILRQYFLERNYQPANPNPVRYRHPGTPWHAPSPIPLADVPPKDEQEPPEGV